MFGAAVVLSQLREREELWQAAPGLVGLRGAPLRLLERIEGHIADLARSLCDDEWRMPGGIALETLARAEYFASFPQWLTVASHLSDDATVLERVANDPAPSAAARTAVAPADAALPPALCYHAYAALAGRTFQAPRLLTTQGSCWRHEGSRFVPLERGWAFTMREIICIGSRAEAERFRARGMAAATQLARALDLPYEVVVASDPFFAPTARGKALLQQIKGLKHELSLGLGGEHTVAAASFNQHETFFGTAFDLRLPDGSPASTACVAFGLERWLLAALVHHGVDPAAWPPALRAPEQRARLAPSEVLV